ncbi:MAG: hypothetical protein S4CHLAM102_10360 [Chlamydiia bacterium]|nr:hypothetical protein [Chlamydiia bacterium]
MISLLKYLFVQNWLRKLISLLITLIIWFVVNNSLTTTKTISGIPIRVVNLPEGKTIKSMQSNGILYHREQLTLTGRKKLLEELNSNDLEIIIDAAHLTHTETIVTITKKNLISLNPELNIQGIQRVVPKRKTIKLSPKIYAKISVHVTYPKGDPPQGYHLLDVWPHQVELTVSGPEDVVQRLQSTGVKLTLDLSSISLAELENLPSHSTSTASDVVSFPVPEEMKVISIPSLSDKEYRLTGPAAENLRIDFIREGKVPLNFLIPITTYLSPMLAQYYHPQNLTIQPNALVETKKGYKTLNMPIYAKGVSESFVDIIKDMLQILVVVAPKHESEKLDWSLQFVNPKFLEERFVAKMMSDNLDEQTKNLQHQHRNDYLRNRFRQMMYRMQLCDAQDKPLDLNIMLKSNHIFITSPQAPDTQEPNKDQSRDTIRETARDSK